LVIVLLEVVAYTVEGGFVDVDIISCTAVAGGYNKVAGGGSICVEPTPSDIISVTELTVEQQT